MHGEVIAMDEDGTVLIRWPDASEEWVEPMALHRDFWVVKREGA